jgi:two-component sensor histidine kinase
MSTAVREELLSIHSSTLPGPGVRTKVVMSTDGKVKTFELPALTNAEAVETANLAGVATLITNWNSAAGAILDPARRGQDEGFQGAGGGFSSFRSSWSYESRWFSGFLNVLAYGSLVGLAHAVHFYRCLRERERRAVLLESHLAKARLHALQARLQPHFLFNALNAVATLLRRDTRAAQEALTSFSELLRLALSQSDKQEVPLREDLEFVQRYVEIQQTRLGDRFRFEQEVEPSALDCLVPALLLQPLVENALRHGIELSSNPGLVRVVVKRQEQRLALRVEDNGVGLDGASPAILDYSGRDKSNTGIGLSNLRARLATLYGAEQKVELVSRPEGGVAVSVEIPLR